MAGKCYQEKQYIAFNKHLYLYIFMFFVMLLISLSCFTENEIRLGIAFLVVCLIAVFVAVLSPTCYVFTKKEVTIFYWFGQKEKIRWGEIRSITEYGSFLSHGGGLPHYVISYPHERKQFFMNGEIAKTRKTKKLLMLYYKQKIY